MEHPMKKMIIYLVNGDKLNVAVDQGGDDDTDVETLVESMARYVRPEASMWSKLIDGSTALVASEKILMIQFIGFKDKEDAEDRGGATPG
jgi:hypothetical protein